MFFSGRLYGDSSYALPFVPRGWRETTDEEVRTFLGTGKQHPDTRMAWKGYSLTLARPV
jgi:hypothetical protein